MIKKLILALLVSYSFSFADGLLQNQGLAELNELASSLRQVGGSDAMLVEAGVYENGAPEKGIEQDLLKAVSIYGEMYRANNNPIAAYKLAMATWQLQKEPNAFNKKVVDLIAKIDGLDPRVYLTNGLNADKELRYQEIAMLNGVLLGIYLFYNEQYQESLKVLNSRTNIANYSISQMYLAFNYLKLDNMNMANFYLNRACHNENPQASVVNFCKNSKPLKRTALLGQ